MSSSPTLYIPPKLDPTRAPIENPLLVVPLRDSEHKPDVFTNVFPLWQPAAGHAVFGGILIGQVIQAAYQTVDPAFALHHLSCSFLAASDASQPLYYHVTRLQDTRTYATRLLKVYQDEDKILLSATCRFALKTNAAPDLHSTRLPDVPSPPPSSAEIVDIAEYAAKMARGDFIHHKGKNTTRADVDPFIFHYLPPTPDPTALDLTLTTTPSAPPAYELHAWVRPHGSLSPSHASRTAVLGTLTDSWFLAGTTQMIPQHLGPSLERLKRMTTMSHEVWFHDAEPELDEWVLVKTRVAWAAHGRCLLEQRVWGRSGRLVLSCVQEALLRVAGPGEQVKMRL